MMTVKIKEQESLIEKRNDVWYSTNNLSLILDKNTKTDDQSNSIETKYLKFKINIEDTQLSTSCSTKQSNSCYHLDFYAMIKSLNLLCSLIITSFKNREKRTFHECDYNERTLAIVDFVDVSTIIAIAFKRSQSQDDWVEIEKQKWKVIKILDKRDIRSKIKYKIHWKST